MKLKLILLLILLCCTIGFYTAYKIYNSPDKKLLPWSDVDSHDSSDLFISKEAIVKKIAEKEKLITTEIDLKETVVIDTSWGNFNIFRKVQSLNFYGRGLYSVDLSKLKPENIVLDANRKIFTLKIQKPVIDMITIDENRTEYTAPERGLLRFGDIKLSPEENQLLLKAAKDKMKAAMQLKQYTDICEENTKKTLKDLISFIVKKPKELSEIKIEIEG